jgi:hypothetical protein
MIGQVIYRSRTTSPTGGGAVLICARLIADRLI